MHNIRPTGQIWSAEALNLARKAQNFVLVAYFLDKCTLWVGKNISFWHRKKLFLARHEFWVVHPCIVVTGFSAIRLSFLPWILKLIFFTVELKQAQNKFLAKKWMSFKTSLKNDGAYRDRRCSAIPCSRWRRTCRRALCRRSSHHRRQTIINFINLIISESRI